MEFDLEINNWTVLIPSIAGLLYFLVVKILFGKTVLVKKGVVNAFGIGLVVGLFLMFFLNQWKASYFIYGLVLLGAVNFLDDLFEIHFAWRLIAQFMVGSFLLMEHDLFYSYWGPVLLFLVVGFLNSFNFMDGINGYVGSYSLALFIPLTFLPSLPSEYQQIGYASILFVLVFLVFNFRSQALAWLGDTGSVAIAFVLLHLFFASFNNYDLYLFLVLGAFFVLDSGYTLLKRQLSKENVFERHHQHLYQIIHNSKRIKSYWLVIGITFLQLVVNILLINQKSMIKQQTFAVASSILVLIIYVFLRKKFSTKPKIS